MDTKKENNLSHSISILENCLNRLNKSDADLKKIRKCFEEYSKKKIDTNYIAERLSAMLFEYYGYANLRNEIEVLTDSATKLRKINRELNQLVKPRYDRIIESVTTLLDLIQSEKKSAGMFLDLYSYAPKAKNKTKRKRKPKRSSPDRTGAYFIQNELIDYFVESGFKAGPMDAIQEVQGLLRHLKLRSNIEGSDKSNLKKRYYDFKKYQRITLERDAVDSGRSDNNAPSNPVGILVPKKL